MSSRGTPSSLIAVTTVGLPTCVPSRAVSMPSAAAFDRSSLCDVLAGDNPTIQS